jgi:hypothetical protein
VARPPARADGNGISGIAGAMAAFYCFLPPVRHVCPKMFPWRYTHLSRTIMQWAWLPHPNRRSILVCIDLAKDSYMRS